MQNHDASLFDFMADLEAQAAAALQRERADEVADRALSAYREVDLQSRLAASQGRTVHLGVSPMGWIEGTVRETGDGWVALTAPTGEWIVALHGVEALRGTSARSLPAEARGVAGKLSFASVLRAQASTGQRTRLLLRSGAVREGRLGRLGADFVELLPTPGDAGVRRNGGAVEEAELISLAHLVALHS